MLFDTFDLFIDCRVPELDKARGSAHCDPAEIGTQVCCKDRVKLAPHRHENLTGSNVPSYGGSGLSSDTSARQKILSTGVEGECFGTAFGKGEDTNQFKRIGVIEENLTGRGDCKQRSPRAALHVGNHSGSRGRNHRFQKKILGHWRRTFGFLSRGDRGKGKSRLFPLFGLRTFIFEESAIDPSPNEIGVLFGDFIAFRRHHRFLGMYRDRIELRRTAISGEGDLST